VLRVLRGYLLKLHCSNLSWSDLDRADTLSLLPPAILFLMLGIFVFAIFPDVREGSFDTVNFFLN
jgi:hypothetical protein